MAFVFFQELSCVQDEHDGRGLGQKFLSALGARGVSA